MDFSISTALDLSNLPETNVISVTEEDLCNASFLFASIMEHRASNKLVLILHNQSFGHYCGICTKLGINLQQIKESGQLLVIDVMEKLAVKWLETSKREDWITDILEETYCKVRSFLQDQSSPATIFIERPDNIGIAHGNWPQVLKYISILSSVKSTGKNGLVYLTKVVPNERPLQVVNSSIRHIADLSVSVRGLRTGSAQDISGSIKIHKKEVALDELKRQSEFHYQLLDRSVRLFAPGTVQFR